ncbi:MAG: hypothetical protein SVW77_00255 [Candidatus Nanohaloarchaea archaeon]|nr:hypothetical protein [Candidatus Nanohaloarchaea archaeon]
MPPLPTVFLSAAGVLLAAGTTAHHLYYLHGSGGELHGSLADYYRVLLPYVLASGVVAAAFFSIFLSPSLATELAGSQPLVDVAFLGVTLIWLGAAKRVFTAVDRLADEYFAEGEDDGG